jgi:beta-galactosidase
LACSPERHFHADHTVFSVNKLQPHADFFAFETQKLSSQNKLEDLKRFQSLNGDWKFHWVRSPKDRVKDFFDPKLDDSNWKTIPVPANWEVEGYDYPIYLDERYPFTTKWPDSPEDYNPVGTYRQTFEIAQEWLGDDIILHFAGAKSAMYVYVNGQFVGYSQGSKTPAEFNITTFVQEGQNLIALQMYRWSDASYLESQDMLRMSGIEREVYMYSRPKTAIVDFNVLADLDADFINGIFESQVKIYNADKEPSSRKIIAKLSDGENLLFSNEKEIKVPAGDTLLVEFEHIIEAVKQWSAEIPNCYQLSIELTDS